MKKLFSGIIIGFFLMLAAMWIFRGVFSWETKTITTEESTVLLERIRTVAKLVTVEGEFSELYDHKDYYWADYYIWRKKAILKIKAKVSVGYDLQKTQFEILPKQKKLIISDLPDPEIISIDSDISYYDITEGTFNHFTAEEMSKLNFEAKKKIEEKARQSDLFEVAEEQGESILELIKLIAEDAGLTIEFVPRDDGSEKPAEQFND